MMEGASTRETSPPKKCNNTNALSGEQFFHRSSCLFGQIYYATNAALTAWLIAL